MKKSILLIFLLCVVSFSFSTNVVSVENAKKVSKNFLIERVGPTKASSMEIVLQQTEYDVEGGAIYYRFQVGQKGFIMISATDVVTPVLAYSLESNYETIPGVDYICNQYKEGIKTAKKNAVVNKQVVDSWKYYTADQFIPVASKSRSITSVEPLVTTLWNQGKYFNTYCPYDIGAGTYSDNRVPVGCVALTMVNIMYYYRYPVQPRGGISYIPLNYDETTGELVNQYPRQTVRFSDYTYNYDAMFNVVNTYDGELEKILYHAGVSNRMGYGPDGSGSISEEALEALKLYFKYSPDGTFEIKDNATTGDPLISDSMWIDGFMKYELDAHRPLFYSGRGNAGGHAWIVDGYCNVEEQTYFHVNWGWGGSGNGFFLFGRFFDGSNDNFSNRESLMKNLYPDDSNAVKKPEISFVRNTASIGSISDGAGHVKYAKNSDRKWMIAAPNATSYEFNFYKIKTEKDHDYITIYNGPTEASGVKLKISGNYLMRACEDYASIDSTGSTHADYTGEQLPGLLTVNADSVLVTFTSDNNDITDYGFLLDYQVKNYNTSACMDKAISNQYYFVITDKRNSETSDDSPYRANATCRFNVSPPNYTNGYACNFRKFDLKTGDFIDIFDNTTTGTPRLLYRFDIENVPSGVFNIDVSKIYVQFVSDNWQEGTGFELESYIILGIDEESGLSDVNIYPNPASNYVNVKFSTDQAENISLQVLDMTGKMIYSEAINHAGGELNHQIPVANFAKGIYFLQLQTTNGKTIHKFIVQ